MRKEVYETGIPLNHIYETYYDDDDKKTMVKAKKEYQGHVDWKATTHYADFGERRLKASTDFTTDYGSYHIKFDYYDDGSLKSADLNTDYGEIELKYSPDGKLETLEKTVNGKKSTFRYTYAEGKKFGEYSIFSAEHLEDTYSSWYINSTGGFSSFDYITNPEKFAKLQEEGVTVSTDAEKKKRKAERKLTDGEKAVAFSMLTSREIEKDSLTIYNRLEKLKSNNRKIGEDVKALKDDLVAVAMMYEHTSWERGDGCSPCGNGEEWTYELDGAIVDIKKGEVIRKVNYSRKVRDSYNGSFDTWGRIDSNMMIRVDGKEVEFYMGDKYNTVASEKIDLDIALKTHESKKHVQESIEKKSSTEQTDSEQSQSNSSNNRGGKGGYGEGR